MSLFTLGAGLLARKGYKKLKGGGVKYPDEFVPNTKQFDADTGKLRDLRDGKIEDVRASTKVLQGQLGDKQDEVLDQLQQDGRGTLKTAQQQQALVGGLAEGSNERIARGFANKQAEQGQKVRSLFAGKDADLKATDFAAQEGLRDKAIFALPELGFKKSDILTRAAANNAQAKQFAETAHAKNRAARFGAVAGIFGGQKAAGLATAYGAK